MLKVINEYDIIFSDYELELSESIVDFNNDIASIRTEEVIDIIYPEDVRWFYRSNISNKNGVLRKFNGYDSLRLETKFQELSSFKGECSIESNCEKIVVKKNLFEVDVRKRTCSPIYWTDAEDEFKVYRGTWFLYRNYLPLTEALADAIESQHMMNFGSLPYSCFEKPTRKKKKILHSIHYANHLVIWYGPKEIYLYDNKSVTKIMKKLKISSSGRRICRGYKEKALFENRPVEITHICFVVHGIGQQLSGKINKQCLKLKRNCKRIMKNHFSVEQRKKFRIEFLPIEWRTGLNLDGGIIDSITPQEFKGLRTIFNSTIMDILYYSSSLYRIEITHGLEYQFNRLYSMFCARNPYFETKGGKISILAHSLGSVICYDILRSWITPIEDLDYSMLIDPLSDQYEELKTKIELLKMAKDKIVEQQKEPKNFVTSQRNKNILNSLKAPNFPANCKNELCWKRLNKIDNFFTIGSPLPVFLTLRGFKPRGNNDHSDILPTRICKRIYNIFHPSDPVAYRLEPLVMTEYIQIKPVHIQSLSKVTTYNDKESNPPISINEVTDNYPVSSTESLSWSVPQSIYSEKEGADNLEVHVESFCQNPISFTDQISESIRNLNDRRKSIIPAVEELQTKIKNLKSFSLFKRITMFVNIMKGQDIINNEDDNSTEAHCSSETTKIFRPLNKRLDFTLGDERNISSFFSLFTAHTSYWEDKTLAKFLLDQVLEENKPQAED